MSIFKRMSRLKLMLSATIFLDSQGNTRRGVALVRLNMHLCLFGDRVDFKHLFI